MSDAVDQLKPCPCGETPSIVVGVGGYDCEFTAKCRGCGRVGGSVATTIVELLAFGDWYVESQRQQAAEAWNASLVAAEPGA